ncbi:MAG: DNA methyltransferase, partial [Verrucomicrobiae bacterium]|nr:DNA methyltransferase [Verrucomicrobiae bacterium]
MNPLETYLRELHEIRGQGVPETSFYPPLRNLLNAVGETLKPEVRCILHPKNRGAGIPDGGLFTGELLKKSARSEPLTGLLPDRGVIEVKSTGDDAWLVADSPQVSKYWDRCRRVLVTNFRDFVLVGQDPQGRPVKLETYRLADSEGAFWQAAAQPR